MIEILGWIGGVCLAACSIPQAYHAYKTKRTDDIVWSFLIIWLAGELFTMTYNFYLLGSWNWPLAINYVVNIVGIGIIMGMKLK